MFVSLKIWFRVFVVWSKLTNTANSSPASAINNRISKSPFQYSFPSLLFILCYVGYYVIMLCWFLAHCHDFVTQKKLTCNKSSAMREWYLSLQSQCGFTSSALIREWYLGMSLQTHVNSSPLPFNSIPAIRWCSYFLWVLLFHFNT